ncbi:iron-containing redox enzyme family protein [Rhizorhabdus dicambivorans]|uniref:Iron-containing redox enzyme family protein n=1 Tax=Rhizorhabdus dicambivorans TaxID=1850238 RepID=A0A2A4FWK6_9SPHN|nr:iron-containing redox enzyme family protein [Rhizorhabdus dicambivorans]ATE67437.1 iron-containing redox enzyme family protein [Rhizorhabdus dicambivorans]PCE42067.1 iron-containing redox enzyme family protein [Rhizorhabdus dicambivorans]
MATRFRIEERERRSQFLTDSFQRGLAHWNRERLAPRLPDEDWARRFERDARMVRLERAFLDELRAEIANEAAAVPTDPDGFIAWFENLKHVGPGQGDPLFPWLAEQATRDELRWFFEQEAAGEAGFDDLVAYTQVKLPVPAKLELARNYWDEMGRGTRAGMHGPMLDTLVETLAVDPSIENTVWQSLALANAMTAMATHRDLAWHSVGALGVIELTAPGRSAMVAKGLRRIGLSDRERRYFDLHAVLDVKHSADWNREALHPLVTEDPRRATAIAEGALVRLRCGARCFDRYRKHLWADR